MIAGYRSPHHGEILMEMMIYHINAFADKLFSGNPAAVCIMPRWLPNETLQHIATEINLPATAFLVEENKQYVTRWFTPEYEIDLGGHAILATAYVIFHELKIPGSVINLYHPIQGKLTITLESDWITLNFPCKTLEIYHPPAHFFAGLNIKPQVVYQYKHERCLAIYQSEEEIRTLNPNAELLKQIPHRGIIVTAKGDKVDFVSRVFYPHKASFEDAMTGSSYCLLAPYWAEQLNKMKFQARQLSKRGGEVICEYINGNVLVSGKAVLFKKAFFNYS